MGKALWKMEDLYNAMWRYEEAVSLNSTKSISEDLEKVYDDVKVSLLETDNLSTEKILATGDMIRRIYVNRERKYQTVYENPVLFPRAPHQVFVDAFSDVDTSKASIKLQEKQFQYEAEVDLYRALESLELNKKIIVLHSFKFSSIQACLFLGSECTSSSGEHDFVVIVRDYAIVLFEVKSPINITDKTFKRNMSDSHKQLCRAKILITNICKAWNIDKSAVFVREYTVFPRTSKSDVINLPSYKKLSADETASNGILFEEDVQNFVSWWKENIKTYLAEISIERTIISSKDIHRLKSTLLGIWCINEKNICDIEICSLGHCVKEADDAVRSAEISQNKLSPVSKSVKTSPKIFKTFFGVDCLTEAQKMIFNDDKVAQFIMGPAGSGKTLLLLGKMIQVFQRVELNNIGTLRRKYLFITGSFELDDLANTLNKAGIKATKSHIVIGGKAPNLSKLRLQRNEDFSQAFRSSQSNNCDAFILHHSALLDPILWPQSNQTDDTIKYALMNLIYNKDNHIFIDDFHNALDDIFSCITARAAPMYIQDYPKTLLHEIVTAMRERSMKNANSNEIDSPYIWLIYDHSQMTMCLEKKDDMLSLDSSRFRRMITYVRDFEHALKLELECDKASSIPVFRSLTKNLRNTVDISRCIENMYIDNSKFYCDYFWRTTTDGILDHLELPKLFQETGHLIHGPKPIFFLVKNSDYQEQVVVAIILDVLEELLKDGKICQRDIAIITDSFSTYFSRTSGKVELMQMDKMILLKRHDFDGVTVRVTEDKDTIQATEWKAVIHITDLFECAEFFLPGEPRYLNDLCPVILKCNHNSSSSDDYNNAKSLLETTMKLAFSPTYVTLSRARVFHVVIGRMGNFERKKFSEVNRFCHENFGDTLRSQSEINSYRFLPDNATRTVNEEGEHGQYKKSNFVYKTVPDSQEHAFLPCQDVNL